MIRIIYFILLFCCISLICKGQEVHEFYRWNENKKNYEFDFRSSHLTKTLDSLSTNGYYTLQVDSVKGKRVYLNKGKNYKRIWVKNEILFKDQAFHSTYNLDSIISDYINEQEAKGYTFANVQLIPLGFKDEEQQLELKLNLGSQRKIDAVKSIGYTKLSKGYIKYGLGLKPNKIYTDDVLQNASRIMHSTAFIEEVQAPQTLFRPDSTIVYLYTKKLKSNVFDGILGFGNDEQGKFKLNGNVLLELNNVFNGLEQIRFNWIGTANRNTTLDFRVKVPYLLKSPIGSETQFKIFKQDSVFVNLNLQERLFYHLSPNSSIGVNLMYTSSNYLLDDAVFAAAYDDYNKIGFGLSYDYFQKHALYLMEGKSMLKVLAATVSRKEANYSLTEEYINKKSKQYEIGLETYRLFELSQKHYFKVLASFKTLIDQDDEFSENELYRIGGFGSVRGFNEESIVANMYGIGGIEYRFLPNEGFYVSLFGDYAFTENKRVDLHSNFLSFGTGLSFLTKLGIFNLSYAVGKTNNLPFDFKDSKIHFGILSQF